MECLIDETIQRFRGYWLLQNPPIDISITEALNFFLAWGISDYYGDAPEIKVQLAVDILRNGLDVEGVIDDYYYKWLQKELPKRFTL